MDMFPESANLLEKYAAASQQADRFECYLSALASGNLHDFLSEARDFLGEVDSFCIGTYLDKDDAILAPDEIDVETEFTNLQNTLLDVLFLYVYSAAEPRKSILQSIVMQSGLKPAILANELVSRKQFIRKTIETDDPVEVNAMQHRIRWASATIRNIKPGYLRLAIMGKQATT